MRKSNIVILTLLTCISAHLGIKSLQCKYATLRLESIAMDSVEMAGAQCTKAMCTVKKEFLAHELNKMVHKELKDLGCEK